MAQDNSNKPNAVDPLLDLARRLPSAQPNDPLAKLARRPQQDKPVGYTLDPQIASKAQQAYAQLVKQQAEDAQAAADSQNLALKILGDATPIGGTIRAITSIARGYANATYEALDEANKLDQIDADIAAGKRPDDYFAEKGPLIAKMTGDMFTGFYKGFFGSVPFGKEAINAADPTNPVKEGWYDVLSSERFKESARLNPALEFARDERDLGWGTIPFLNVPFTRAGLTSFALDVFTDPTSYMALGLGGAIRGTGQAISQTSKAAKALELGKLQPELFVPKNVEGFRLQGVKGKLYKPRPLPSGRTAATVVQDNRGVASFIFENAGQGFLDVHRNAIARIQNKWLTRADRIAKLKATIMRGTVKNLTDNPDMLIEEAISASTGAETALRAYESKGEKQFEATPEELQIVRDELAAEIGAKWREATDPATRNQLLEDLARVTDENAAQDLGLEAKAAADAAVRELLRTSPLVQTTVKNKFIDNPELVGTSARALETAVINQGRIAGSDAASIGSFWNEILKTGSKRDKMHVIAAMLLPPGYRSKWARDIAKEEKAGAAATGNIISNYWGLNLLAKGKKRSAKIDNEYASVREHIKGTKLTRGTARRQENDEINAILGESKRLADLSNGPGSKNTKGRRAVFNVDQIATRFLDDQIALGKAWYDEQVAKGAISGVDVKGNPVEWSDLTLARQASIIGDLLNDPDMITPSMLDAAGFDPLLIAARVNYLVKRSVATETPEYQAIKRYQRKQYNPATAIAEHPKVSRMWLFGAREGAVSFTQVKRAIRTVTGLKLSPEAKNILRAEGISPSKLRKDGSMEFRSPYEIEEILKASILRQAVRDADAQVQNLVTELKATFPEDADKISVDSFSPKMTKSQKDQLRAFGAALTDVTQLRDDKINKIMEAIFPDAGEVEAAYEVLRVAGVDPHYRGKMLTNAVTATGRIFKVNATQEVKGQGILERFINDLPKFKDMEGPIMGRQVFGKLVTQLERFVAESGATESLISAARQMLDLLKSNNVVDSKLPFSLKELNAFNAQLNTILTKSRAAQSRGRVPLFDDLFKKDNTLDRQGLADFVYRGYLASRGAKAEDEGLFADFVYGKVVQTIKATGSDQNLNKATPEQLKELIKQTFADWDGEGLTLDILQDVARETGEKGNTAIGANVMARIQAETEEAIRSAKASVAEDLIKTQEAERIVRELEAEMTGEGVAFLDQGFDRLPRAVAENPTEEQIAKEAILSAEYTIGLDRLEAIQKLLQLPGGFESIKQVRIVNADGKAVTNPADLKEGDKLVFKAAKEAFQTGGERLDIRNLEAKLTELVMGTEGEAADAAAKASLAKLETQRDKINAALAGPGMTQPAYREATTERVYTPAGQKLRDEQIRLSNLIMDTKSRIGNLRIGADDSALKAKLAVAEADKLKVDAKLEKPGTYYKDVETPAGPVEGELVPTQRARDLQQKLREVNIKIDQISKQRFKGIPEATRIQQQIENLRNIARLKDQVGISIWKTGQAAAIRDIQLHRAEELLKNLWPKWAEPATLLDAAKRTGNVLTARAHIRAKLMLATILAKVDEGIRITDLKEQATRRTGSDLAKERKTWNGIMDKLAAKVTRATGEKMPNLTEEQIRNLPVSAFRLGGEYYDKPLVLIEKIRNFEINTPEQKEDWQILTEELLKKGITDASAGPRYQSAEDFFASYQRGGDDAPSLEEAANILERMGSAEAAEIAARIRAGEKPRANKRTILNIMNSLEIGKEVNLEEAMARLGAATSLNVAGGKTVDELIDQMKPDADLYDDVAATYSREINMLEKTGQTDIIQLVELMDGREMAQFIVKRIREGAETFKDALGRVIDSNKPQAKRGEKDAWALLRTFEPQTQYTGYKAVWEILERQAEDLGLELGSKERAAFIDGKMNQIQRLSALRKLRYGIMPTITIKLTEGEGNILGIFSDSKPSSDALRESVARLESVYPGLTKEVMLSLSDIKLALPEDVRQLLFYMGKLNSLPETALAPGVRMLIGMRSMLPDGQIFDEETAKFIAKKMFDLILNSVKTTSYKGGPARKGESIFDADEAGTIARINTFIRVVMTPKITDDLYTRHIINSAVNIKVLRHKTSALTKSQIDKLYKVLDNPVASSGDRIQAAIDLTKSINALTKSKLDPTVETLIDHDLSSALIAQMSPDDFNVFITEWLRVSDETLSEEAQGIASLQQKSRKNKKEQALLVDLMNRRSKAWNNMIQSWAVREANATGQPVPAGKMQDQINNHEASIGQMNWAFKWVRGVDNVLKSLFYAHGQETIAPGLYGPVHRLSQEQVTSYSRYLEDLNKNLRSLPYEGDIVADAFNILKQIPLDELSSGIAAMSKLQKVYAKQIDAPLTGEETAQLIADMKPLEKYFDVSNPAMRDAVRYMGHALNHLFGGGRHSLVVSAGLNPIWLQRNLLEVGGSTSGIDFSKFRTLDELNNSWREAEPADALEMMRLIHAALKRAEILPNAAANLTMKFGVPKSNYKTYAEAQADGLYDIPSVDKISKDVKTVKSKNGKWKTEEGDELVYFLDTENYYYPAMYVNEIYTASAMFTAAKHFTIKSRGIDSAVRGLERIQTDGKRFMTVFRPGNWVQSGLGGFWSNFMAGMNSPLRYGQSMAMLSKMSLDRKALKEAGIEVDKLDKLIAVYERSAAEQGLVLRETSKGKFSKFETVPVLINGRRANFKMEDLAKLYQKLGGRVTTSQIMDPLENPTLAYGIDPKISNMKKLRTAFEKTAYGVGKGAAVRDDFYRLALWIDVLIKQGGPTLTEAGREALRKVDRYHPQSQETSVFNQKYTKRATMFHTWKSKTSAWVLMDLLDDPKLILTTLKLQYNRAEEEGQDVTLGDFTPQNYLLPGYAQNSTTPFTQLSDGLYSFSLANPVTDVLGQTSYLGGISFNTYEPIEEQLMRITQDTLKNVLTSSDPIFAALAIDWVWNRKTMRGEQLEDVPQAVEDLFARFGLDPYHALLAATMPDIFKRSKWDGLSQDQVTKDQFLQFINWMSGLRIRQADDLKNRQKAMTELLQKIRKMQGLD